MDVEDTATRSESLASHSAPADRTAALLWIHPHELPLLTPLDLSTIDIGRSARCAIQLQSAEASRLHARVERDGTLWLIRDTSSRNGVFLDGRSVESAVLRPGSILRLGGAVAIVIAGKRDAGRATFAEIAPGIFGGARLADCLEPARRAAVTDLPIVLEAETGCGKERVARAIHEWSARKGPFVAVNCAAIPESLAEAELFGYRRGAFTGAERAHAGYFRAAQEGTLFLDEVLDLPASVQAKLLRAIEQREIAPLGESAATKIDVRIIAASQGSLAAASRAGRMRSDLYARLNGMTVLIPPLRERLEDVPYLFRLFLVRAANVGLALDLDARTVERLCLHGWPLNVRELENLAKRLTIVLSGERKLKVVDVEEALGSGAGPELEPSKAPAEHAEEWTSFVDALEKASGNVIRASQQVGISRQRAYRLMAMHPNFDVHSTRVADGVRRQRRTRP